MCELREANFGIIKPLEADPLIIQIGVGVKPISGIFQPAKSTGQAGDLGR